VHDLGIENFRVLTVTTDRRRVDKMLKTLSAITDGRGSNMFLFVDQATLAYGNPLTVKWMTGKGQNVRLAD